MKLEVHGPMVYLTNDEGVIHIPGTLYLNEDYSNPHTREVVGRSLRIWARFASAFDIDLAKRSMEGHWLTEKEKKALHYLAFRPIQEIEAISHRAVRRIASASHRISSKKSPNSVEPNTAVKRLANIAGFLEWYHQKIIEPRLPITSPVIDILRRQVESCDKQLKEVAGTSSCHPHRIRSVPSRRFLDIYAEIYSNYQMIFKTAQMQPSRNASRDRAVSLLACEGMRPGAIGNLAKADFRWEGGKTQGFISIKNNTMRRDEITTGTPVQKGSASNKNYNSEITISIWPTTAEAIQEYINGERAARTSKGLKNQSKGFLFLADHGGPINNRGTITHIFREAARGLAEKGLLSRDPRDPYLNDESYEFSAYLLRHSSASIYYATQIKSMRSEVVMDHMKMRFGWTENSTMPSIYAKRAMIDFSGLVIEDFIEQLMIQAKKTNS